MKVLEILDDVEIGSVALPIFQRSYVWDRGRVKKLMNSMYRGWPVGTLLIWRTLPNRVDIRPGGEPPPSGYVDLLLDGQQRVTSLYGIIRGKPPAYFEPEDEPKAKAFTDLYFNVEKEAFEFYNARTMRHQPEWIPVTKVFLQEPETVVEEALSNTASVPLTTQLTYLERIRKIRGILDANLHDERIVGQDRSLNDIVEIFHAVNSAGRTLSQGDLALARIGADWPDARREMQQRLKKWDDAGFSSNLDWLLRCITALTSEASEFHTLHDDDVSTATIQQALGDAEKAVDILLDTTWKHLGMDNSNVHRSKQAFPVMVKYLVDNCGGDFPDGQAKAQLLHWYVSASLWGRFSGPTETNINEDIRTLQETDPLAALIKSLADSTGGRSVGHEDFNAVRTNARFFPLLHMMSRVWGARDWQVPMPKLSELEAGTALQLHHIFPKAVLQRRTDLKREDSNNFGNLAFISRQANLAIGDTEPAEYLAEIDVHYPHALRSQWIPDDPELWKLENYEQFILERRRLLAEAANEFLGSLRDGQLPPATWGAAPVSMDENDEQFILDEINRFVVAQGLPAGELGYEILSVGGAPVTLDLAWPNGLQDGLSEKVAVLINEDNEVRKAANDAGFKLLFADTTAPQDLRRHVEEQILGGTDGTEAATA